MRLVRSLFVAGVALGWAGPATADIINVQFLDIYAPSGGILINSSNPTHDFEHTIVSPSEAPPSYNPATDTLTGAELVLTFSNSTQGNDAIVVTWSNFDDSLTGSSGTITGGPGFSSPLDFQINLSLLENQGILNVLLTKGNDNPGSSWTFLTSTLTVNATREVGTDTGPGGGTQVPEPTMLALLGVALLGGAARARQGRA